MNIGARWYVCVCARMRVSVRLLAYMCKYMCKHSCGFVRVCGCVCICV
jgi:hypothetical protein